MCDPHTLSAPCVYRFLSSMGQPSLLAWLKVEPHARPARIRCAIDAQRRWAQAQQANPRHREQALWTITHHRRLVACLVEQPGGVERIEAELRDARRAHLLAELEQHSTAWAEDETLLADLRARLGGEPREHVDEELLFDIDEERAPPQPDLDATLAAARRAGLAEAYLEQLVSMHRAVGLGDAQIALMLGDEVHRAGRATS